MESWLSPNVTDGLLDPLGRFKIYRKDRLDGYGGVVLFVSNLVKFAPIFLGGITDDNIELVGCTIFFGSVKIALLCCY